MRTALYVAAIAAGALAAAWVLLWVLTFNARWTIGGLDGETRYRSLWSWLFRPDDEGINL